MLGPQSPSGIPRLPIPSTTADPGSKHTLRDPKDKSRLPDRLTALLRPTVVQGDFCPAQEMLYERAIS